MSRDVIIDNLTIRLPHGWNGDRVHLARRIAEQIQQQAADLESAKAVTIKVSSHYGGSVNRVAGQIARELSPGVAVSSKKGGEQG